MEMAEKIRELIQQRKWAVFMTVCGCGGMLLIMISSLIPDKAEPVKAADSSCFSICDADSFCHETEQRLAAFLSDIDGAGEVKVYLSAGSSQRYIYAAEGRRSRSDSKTEEEEKYVMIGSGSEKSALVETVELPEIKGAVIVCGGGDDAAVRERMYKAASAALGISTAKIYVSKLR